MIKVVFDTNILISSIFWSGIPRRIVDMAVAGRIQSLSCSEILREVESVLIKKFPDIPYRRVRDILRDVLSYSHLVITEKLTIPELRDLKDIAVMACAVSAGADYLVTGDKDLLSLKEFRGIKIYDAKSFLDEILKSR